MALNSAYTNVTEAAGTGAIGNAIVERYMVQKLLTLADKATVFYKLGNKVKLPQGESKVASFQRWERIAPPGASLTEGVTPRGTKLNVSRISVTAEQWGSFCQISDVMEMTVRYQPFQRAVQLVGMQAAETLDREIQKVLLAGTNVYYPNGKTARSSLTDSDVVDTPLLRKIRAQLKANGAPGSSGSDGRKKFIGVCDPFSAADMMADTTFIESAKFQNLEPLTTGEFGEWQGIRWQESNFIPVYSRVTTDTDLIASDASPATSTVTGAVNLTAGDYISIAIGYNAAGFATLFPATTYASLTAETVGANEVLQVTTAAATTATDSGVETNGSFAGDAGPIAYDIYVSAINSTSTFYLVASNVAGGTTVTVGGAGSTGTNIYDHAAAVTAAVSPPVQPATGVSVHNLYIFGNEWYSVIEIDGIKTMMTPATATHGNELAQRRSVGWKFFSKALITNQNFGVRIEAASAND
jgi:N4-gp56 family major capsid protein